MAITVADATANQMLQQLQIDIDTGGFGTVEFKTAESEVQGTSEIATVTFSDPSFGSAASGVISANNFTPESSATAGTATHFTIFSGGGTYILKGTVGTGSGDMNLTSNALSAGDTVDITAMSFSLSGA